MFAVRLALSRQERLMAVMGELVDKKQIDPKDFDAEDPLGFLIHDQRADTIVDAAYRFCRYEPGTHVILSGTGSPEHMAANIASFDRPPLPTEDSNRLEKIFGRVDSVTGQ